MTYLMPIITCFCVVNFSTLLSFNLYLINLAFIYVLIV